MPVAESFVRRVRHRLGTQMDLLIRNSSWVFAANAFRTVLAFARSIIIARGLGAERFGTYVLIIALADTIQEFLNPNMGTAVIKFGADYRAAGAEDRLVALVKAGAAACLVLAVLSVLLVWGASGLVYGTFFDAPGWEGYLVLYAAAAGLSLLDSVSGGLLRLFYKFRLNALVQMGTGVLDLVLIVAALTLYPQQLAPFLVAVIVARFLDSGVLNGAALWELRGVLWPHRRARLGLLRGEARAIGSFVLSNSGSRTLKTLMDRGDVLLLGALSGVRQVGFYEIAKKLAYVVLRFTDPLSNSVYPQVAELTAARRYGEVRRLVGKVSLVLAVPMALVFAAALVLDEWVLATLYGAAFLPAAAPFLFHLVAASTSAVFFWHLAAVFSLGKVERRFFVMLAATAAGGVLAWLWAPAYGAAGVAAASLAAKTFVLVALLYVVYKHLR